MRLLFLSCLFASAVAFDGVHRSEGDACGPGNQWVCRKLMNCQSALDKDEEGEDLDTCSVTSSGIFIVCCSDATPQPSVSPLAPKPRPKGAIAKKMCEKYAQYVFRKTMSYRGWNDRPVFSQVDECGIKAQPLIVGGQNASLREFPHMAQIGFIRLGEVLWLCGGSLISDRWVLSAAHCTTAPDDIGNAVLVRLGELDTTTDLDGAYPIIYGIEERKNHPNYKDSLVYDDIALYKLNGTVNLNSYIRPICLQVEDRPDVSYGLATGWGHTQWGGEASPRLQKAYIDLLNINRCKQSYRNNPQGLDKGILEERQLCTWGKGKTDTCQGDSGGPLQIPITRPYCMYQQFGVTSFGVECASTYPGVYTKVSYYLPWIESVVWPDETA